MLARAATLASQAQHGHSASEVVLAADGDAPPVLVKNPERQVPPLVKGTSLKAEGRHGSKCPLDVLPGPQGLFLVVLHRHVYR